MRLYGQYPEQLVLYVGNEPLRMQVGLDTGGMVCKPVKGIGKRREEGDSTNAGISGRFCKSS